MQKIQVKIIIPLGLQRPKEAKEAMVEGVAVLSMEPQKQPLPVATILSQHQAAGV